MPVDRFDADHLLSGVVVTVAAGLALVLVASPIAVPVLVTLAFACGRLGGRDAGLGSAATGAFMFGFAITEPHFVWEMANRHDQVLFGVLLVLALVASEVRVRRLQQARRSRAGLRSGR